MVSTTSIGGLFVVLLLLGVIEITTGFFREIGRRLFKLFLGGLSRLCHHFFGNQGDEDSNGDGGQPATIYNVGDIGDNATVVIGSPESEVPIDQDFDVRENDGS